MKRLTGKKFHKVNGNNSRTLPFEERFFFREAMFSLFLAFVLSATSSASLDLPFIRRYVKDFMRCNHIPGSILAVVKLSEDEQEPTVEYSEGFGKIHPWCKGEKCEKVNEHTKFGVGSVTKHFTALTIGMLLSQNDAFS